ncbi:Lignostilbene-alpha,beta-dioxygenase isozyme I [Cercospora beticola]|uniref:Lignostilbene-alpha,beta-dioxygenase isozyme I n=1 Tax=Cercospora beticola TaxID=122368 RepID=A0A2G5HHY3_CERBT|nr:Lignostilbene-alpha,beta-dioxygenase isozyme I [Cercospora beticola]PIA92196.1 Lignostilbene-alpha,beta-dioxygenase isozyme I [Cercospora beticola]
MENRFGLKSSWDHFLPSPADMPQGRFECELDEVIVYGEIPKTIDGTWYRMLNDPHYPPAKGTPFVEGDGHLCAFRIQDGKISMKTKYVQTERWLLERKAGRRLFGMYRNPYDAHPCIRLANDATGNTNIIYWGGNLLALAERGLPYAMDPDTLETRGADPFAGQTRAKTFAAHPKVDPFKNELVTWSYNAKGLATRDFATYSISEDSVISNENWYQQDKTGWPHDGWITENWIILANMPFTTNSEEVLKQGGHYWTFVDGQPQEFLVAPRKSGAPRNSSWKVGEFRKYVTDHGLIVHAGNAWEAEDGTLQLESHFLSFNVFPFWNPPGYNPLFQKRIGSVILLTSVSQMEPKWRLLLFFRKAFMTSQCGMSVSPQSQRNISSWPSLPTNSRTEDQISIESSDSIQKLGRSKYSMLVTRAMCWSQRLFRALQTRQKAMAI